MFAIHLQAAEHTKRYSVVPLSGSGWAVRIEEDQAVTREIHYHDWHRVERVMSAFKMEAMKLAAQGWIVQDR